MYECPFAQGKEAQQDGECGSKQSIGCCLFRCAGIED